MSKLIVIGLLFLCAENAYLDWYYDHSAKASKMVSSYGSGTGKALSMGIASNSVSTSYTRKQVVSMDALVARFMGDSGINASGLHGRGLPNKTNKARAESPTQQIASLWNITPQDMRSKVDIFGETVKGE